jgi:hypothetical protein
MKNTQILTVISLITLGLISLSLITKSNKVRAVAGNVVISEIQIATTSAVGDFVELYNPTSGQVDLNGFKLVKRTSSGSTDTQLVSFGSGDKIEAHGFILWCNTSIATDLNCDKHNLGTIANNNSIGLRNGNLDTGEVIDAVTIGVALHSLGEGGLPATPGANQSIERKAKSSSDATSMGVGGADEFAGNGEDTDNNANDFILRENSQPQNSLSAIEPAFPIETPTPSITLSPTPTNSPTPTDILSPTPTITEVPTITPTLTSTPTPTLTITPTPTTMPSPTEIPSNTPTPTFIPTITPTPTVSPSITPTPSIIVRELHLPNGTLVCTWTGKMINIFGIHVTIPSVRCAFEKN